MRLLSDRKRANNISHIPARLVVVTCLILVLAVVALAWTRESGNSGAREAEAARIKGAIETELHKLALDAFEFANMSNAHDPPDERAQRGARQEPKVGVIPIGRLVDPPTNTIEKLALALRRPFAEIETLLAQSLRGAIADAETGSRSSLRLYARHTLSGFVTLEESLFAWAIAPAHLDMADGARRAMAVVSYEKVDTAFAGRIAVNSRSGFIEFHARPPERPEVHALSYINHGSPVYVSWRPYRPGDRLSTQLGALLISIMAVYTGFVAYFMTRKLAVSEFEKARLATQDSLTGTANRLLFTIQVEDEIARARRVGKDFALLYIDFDRFKEINDTFGHDIGDQLIILAARRIQEKLGPNDRLGRFGGDEFGVIQYEIGGVRDCEVLAEALLRTLREPFHCGAQDLYIGASIGIAVCLRGGEDRAELMRRADLALYRAKNAGRGRFAFFDEAMNSELQARKQLEDEMRLAIKKNQFEVHYQPIVAVASRRLCCVEALVRWNHPTRGLIAPDEFIALAEERGMIIDLGEWVLRRACLDAAHWPGVKLAVNVSSLQFRHKDFVNGVFQILDDTGFDPTRLELEMTESVVIDSAEQAAAAIATLRAKGIRLSLDDFGTGYSSLIYLRRFAIDKIKIDRSFVEQMASSTESREIVRNVIDLGRRLGLLVTAEGVENEQQIALLEEFGCHEMQGYYFGRPITALAVMPLIGAGALGGESANATGAQAA